MRKITCIGSFFGFVPTEDRTVSFTANEIKIQKPGCIAMTRKIKSLPNKLYFACDDGADKWFDKKDKTNAAFIAEVNEFLNSSFEQEYYGSID